MILILMLIGLLIGLTVRRLLWKWWMLDKVIHCCNGLIQFNSIRLNDADADADADAEFNLGLDSG